MVVLARRVTCGVAVVALGGMMLMSAPAWGDTSLTFGFAGGFQSLTLPQGVPAVTLRVEGGSGGDGALGGGTGGTGATVSATFSVPTTGTQTLEIYVGVPASTAVWRFIASRRRLGASRASILTAVSAPSVFPPLWGILPSEVAAEVV